MRNIGDILKLACLISLMVIALTGCTVDKLNDYIDNFSGALSAESQYNKDCVDKLVKAGIMDKENGDVIKAGITASEKKYTDPKTELDETFLDAISWVIPRSDFDSLIKAEYRAYLENPENVTKPNMSEKAKISKLLNVKSIKEDKDAEGNATMTVKYKGEPLIEAASKVEPINFIGLSDDDEEFFNSKSTVPVYILRSADYNDNELSYKTYKNKNWYDGYYAGQSMDEVLNAIKDLRENKDTLRNKGILAQYFSNSGTVLANKLNFKTERQVNLYSNGIHSITLGVTGFDARAIEEVYGRLEKNESRYFIYDNVAYLLEYPVHYINKIVADENGGGNWELKTDKTNMIVNFLSGELLDTDGKLLSQADNTDSIYHVNQTTGSSSFMFGGELVTYNDIGSTNKDISNCIQIVLRDYLELLYIPEAIPNEGFVALGRRIRIDNTKGSLGTPLGHFIDKKGKSVWDTKILATDIISSVLSGVKTNLFDNGGTKVKVNLKYGMDMEEGNSGGILGDDGLIDDSGLLLKTKYMDDLRVTFEFPWKGLVGGPNIAGVDLDNENIKGPQLYGIATDINLFDSGLYQSWINVSGDGEDNGSLEWWNGWLEANGYKYRALLGAINDALGQNYSYDLAKEGYIVLDLDTISKIQRDYDRENETARVTGVRTAFIIVGTLLIVYSILIPIAWLYDVNIVNGSGLLSKISFGHWVSVASSDEIPSMGVGNRQYMNFGAVVIRALIICAIGVLLYIVDFVVLTGMVWELFGNIVNSIEQIVFNLF